MLKGKTKLPDIREPQKAILWALENVEKIALVTSLGKQTMIIIDIVHKLGKDISMFIIDTDLLFKETYELKERVEQRYGVEIQTIKTDIGLEDQDIMYGPNLWYRNPDLCCKIRKVDPLNNFLKNYDAWITGVRRDQSLSRRDVLPIEFDDAHGLLKINPLAYYTLDDVNNYISNNKVPCNDLFSKGYSSVGCMPCTSKVSGDGERDGRWKGLNKTECGIHSYKQKGEK